MAAAAATLDGIIDTVSGGCWGFLILRGCFYEGVSARGRAAAALRRSSCGAAAVQSAWWEEAAFDMQMLVQASSFAVHQQRQHLDPSIPSLALLCTGQHHLPSHLSLPCILPEHTAKLQEPSVLPSLLCLLCSPPRPALLPLPAPYAYRAL
jgi:hypothetical protein